MALHVLGPVDAPYAELADWEPARAEIGRLDAVREATEEELLAARLASGEHRAAIAEAERLVRDSPQREERWCLLAPAHYQSGRQAEALSSLRSARHMLDDDLGIQPGERLIDLETAIMRHDPALAPARHESRVGDDCPYRGLSGYGPDDADEFFGRDAEIEAVVDRLARRRFLALTGASGSGKSSLALAGVVPMFKARGWTAEIVRPW
ncbi:BTAD domain-containing putative transcriptional regulator [Microbacterium deminutum]|uniref:nSTAND1 domain-containing NTPase n=1 Tax=Microbacterium deminutum TaxID=344164 RepID=UPI0031DEFF28